MASRDARAIIYGYVPSLTLAALGVALFAVASLVHLWLLIKHRTWYYSPLLVGTCLEIVGYIFRFLSSRSDANSVMYFVIQYFCIVVAPVFFSAAIYTVLSVIISHYGRDYAVLSPKVVLGIFITDDIISTMIQIAGAALVGRAYSNGTDPDVPMKILLAGLSIQVASFAIFLVIFIWTLLRARKSPVKISNAFLATFITATLAIFLRTCFRVAEGAPAVATSIRSQEAYFGALEFAPVVVAVFLLAYAHPGRYFTKPARSGGKREGSYA